MGEYAEMMLDGTCCSSCGEYLGGDEGFPTICAACRRTERLEPSVPRFNRYSIPDPKIQKPGDPLRSNGRISCPFCVKRPKATGFGDHMLAEHRDKWPKS